jgi:hypothetical protein
MLFEFKMNTVILIFCLLLYASVSGERPFKCRYVEFDQKTGARLCCGKTFARSENKKIHERVHTSEFLFCFSSLSLFFLPTTVFVIESGNWKLLSKFRLKNFDFLLLL